MKTLDHVHETVEGVASVELTPPHPPRESTPAYREAHRRLIDEQDSPCLICGVRKSTLGDPAQNPAGATQMESHHFPVERSLLDACDWRKVAKRFPSVKSQGDLEQWVDTEENLVALCDVHHRGVETGIHHLSVTDWSILPFLLSGYRVVARAQDAQTVQAADEALLKNKQPPHS